MFIHTKASNQHPCARFNCQAHLWAINHHCLDHSLVVMGDILRHTYNSNFDMLPMRQIEHEDIQSVQVFERIARTIHQHIIMWPRIAPFIRWAQRTQLHIDLSTKHTQVREHNRELLFISTTNRNQPHTHSTILTAFQRTLFFQAYFSFTIATTVSPLISTIIKIVQKNVHSYQFILILHYHYGT